MKKVLVTGGAGFIGSHTVDALIKKGYKVRILDSLSKPVHILGRPPYLNKEAEFILGDVRDRSSWEKALKNIDVVYHLAAYQDYLTNFSKFFDVNAKGTALLYEIIIEKKLSVEKVIVASSQAIYGEGLYTCKNGHKVFPESRRVEDLKKNRWEFVCPYDKLPLSPEWVNEEFLVNPHNSYGISKYSEEKIALHLGKRYGIPSTAMRYSIVQGSRQSPFNLYSGALRIFVTSLLAGIAPIIYEDGRQIRDYVNINDVVKANLLVIENNKADYQAFNVGGGKKWTVIDFYNKVRKVLNVDIEPNIPGLFRVGDTRHIFSDTKNIEKLGFKTTTPIENSIKEYADWVVTLPYFSKMVKSASKFLLKNDIIKTADSSFSSFKGARKPKQGVVAS